MMKMVSMSYEDTHYQAFFAFKNWAGRELEGFSVAKRNIY
jgi:hypothetical protein